MIRPRRPRRRHALALAASVTAIALATGVPLSASADPVDVVDIDVVTVNDFHGRIEADGSSAGAAVLAGAVRQFRAENPNTIFAAAGDLIGASTFTSSIQDDDPTIDALNAAGLEVSAAGNHEFDAGWAELRDRVQDRADWEYLSANVVVKATGRPALAPSWVKEVGGVRVGFIGAVTEALPSLVMAGGIGELEVRDIVSSVNATAAGLRDGNPSNGEADVIVLLVHEGAATTDVSSITPTSPLGRVVDGVDNGVDAIVSAHTHLAYNHVINGRPVVSAGQYGENVGLMSIRVDRATKELISISNEVTPLTEDDEPRYPAVPEVQAIVDQAAADAEIIGQEKVGEITADLKRARQSNGTTENRGGESTLVNFVADTHQWATGADLALMIPGGVRSDLLFAPSGAGDSDGTVTYREVATLQPWAGTLITMDLTGAQVKQILEEQWQPAGASRPLLKLGVSKGFFFTYDPTAAAGSHITSIALNGRPIRPDEIYRVAATEFLATGGDNFQTFTQGANVRDSGRIDSDSMIAWFEKHGAASPDLAQRSVGVVLSPPDADGYSAGDQVTASFSSLAFSAGESAPGQARLTLEGTTVASGTIDPTVLDATDEAGRVTLTFTVPDGMVGARTLVLDVAGSGTRVELPIVFTSLTDASPRPSAPSTGPSTDPATGHGGEASNGPGGTAMGGRLASTGTDLAPSSMLPVSLALLGVLLVLGGRGGSRRSPRQ